MELKRITLPPITAPGEVTTFYSYESGTARSVALSNTAVLLASGQNATVPVLMIDWDTESPGLHQLFGRHGEHPGVLEYFSACRDHLARLGLLGAPGRADDMALARQVLDAVDWEQYVERVDNSRPLYLMRAGCVDDTYGERADAMDWDALFGACPALFRCFAEHVAARFRHVLIDARSGRSAAVSICTTLLPHRLIAPFKPTQSSLDGLAGVVERAIAYRCSHEDEQRPLLLYPVPTLLPGVDCQRRHEWRYGNSHTGDTGYQVRFERLMRQCYGLTRVSLDSYFDEVQLQQSVAVFSGAPLHAPDLIHDERFSLRRTCQTLLHWLGDGYFPWQSLDEIRLLGAVGAARQLQRQRGGHEAAAERGRAEPDQASSCETDPALGIPLTGDLYRLGELYREQGRVQDAIVCLDESIALRERLLGAGHPDTRASRFSLAGLLRDSGSPGQARAMLRGLLDDCLRRYGSDHPDTLAARAALAETMALLGEWSAALSLHEEINASCERLVGSGHPLTLEHLAAQARTLARHGEASRARMVYERVLEGRERLLGSAHHDTLRCQQELARLLVVAGDLPHARQLQAQVVAARDCHLGSDHRCSLEARAALVDILAAQGDLDSTRREQEILAHARVRRLGVDHPATLEIQLALAATLSQLGDLQAARRLQEQVVAVSEQVRGGEDLQTLGGKQALAATLARQGHSVDARKLEDNVLQTSARLIDTPGMVSGAHPSHAGMHDLRKSILETRDDAGQVDSLAGKLATLQELIDKRQGREARALADTLRKAVLRPDVANALRLRGVAMIKGVYMRENDKDALLAFAQDEVSSLQEALAEASGGRPVAAC